MYFNVGGRAFAALRQTEHRQSGASFAIDIEKEFIFEHKNTVERHQLAVVNFAIIIYCTEVKVQFLYGRIRRILAFQCMVSLRKYLPVALILKVFLNTLHHVFQQSAAEYLPCHRFPKF